jgi:hypothetical protein
MSPSHHASDRTDPLRPVTPGLSDEGSPLFREALAAARTQHGTSLLELSAQRPLLVVFLRHFG